jgi:hypothetical protein
MTKSKTPAGPTPNELRLRGELDRLRRELGRLRKQAQADADTAAPPPQPETPPAATELEPEPAEAVATPEPVVASRPSIGVDGADGADGADGGEAGKLRQQVTELSAAKQRLSKLYFSQLEENRKRSQKLHQILENISEINSELDLGALLKRLAQTIRASLGFRFVLIRIREPGTQTLSACASAGIEPEAWEALEREDIEVEKFLSWLRDDFKVSQSYFISHNNAFSKMLPAGYTPEIGPREEWEWHPEDVLLVPLFNRTGEPLAYFSVDDPEDRLVPSREVVGCSRSSGITPWSRSRTRASTTSASSIPTSWRRPGACSMRCTSSRATSSRPCPTSCARRSPRSAPTSTRCSPHGRVS